VKYEVFMFGDRALAYVTGPPDKTLRELHLCMAGEKWYRLTFTIEEWTRFMEWMKEQ
jgi:hypothetical protein